MAASSDRLGDLEEMDSVVEGVTPRRRKSERTRARILTSARTVFERSGHRDTRVADIAAEAKVAHGTFYRYFESKTDVFRAIADVVRADLIGAQGRIPTIETDAVDGSAWVSSEVRVRAALRRYLERFRRNARFIALLEEAGIYDDEIRRIRIDIRASLSRNTARFLEYLGARGELAPGLDVPYTTELIGAMVDRFAYSWFVLGADFDEERAVEALTKGYLRLIGWAPLLAADQAGGVVRSQTEAHAGADM